MKLIILFTIMAGFSSFASSPLSKACENFKNADMQDGSDYYAAISRYLVAPLHKAKMSHFAIRLEVSTIFDGNSVSEVHCEGIQILASCLSVLEMSDNGQFDNGKEYFEAIKGQVLDPLNDAGYEGAYDYFYRTLDPLESNTEELSLKTCEQISGFLKV